MLSHARSLTRSDEGASAVEYGLLVFAIAAAVIATVFLLGGVVRGMFEDTCAALERQDDVSGTCESSAPTT